MYDLAPPTMKAQFNLINKPNQSIKLSVDISSKSSNKNDLKKYIYNKLCIFKYSINIINSQYSLNIYQQKIPKSHFNKSVLGSFIYDNSIKYSISQITVVANKKIELDPLVYGFLKKDFISSSQVELLSNWKISNYKITKKVHKLQKDIALSY